MGSKILFPDWRRMNPRREIRESETPAPVVFDFGAIHEQNKRRQRFHEIMGHIDIFLSQEVAEIETRQDVNFLFLLKMVEALKEIRYELDLDVVNALKYMAMVVSTSLIEVSPRTFVMPDYSVYKNSVNPGQEIILTYVFSDLPPGHPTLEDLKYTATAFFTNVSEKTREIYGDTHDEEERIEATIAQIFPLVIDALRQYVQYFRSRDQQGTNENIVSI